MKFDSLEEEYFYEWLKELQKKKYITDIRRAESIILSKPVLDSGYTVYAGIIYTPDFEFKVLKEGDYFQPKGNLTVSPQARNSQKLIYDPINKKCVVEVKPLRDVRGKTTEVMIKIKWVHAKHGVFVQLVKVPGSSNTGNHLFKKTFTPKSYLKTQTGKKRKMNYKPIFLK